MIDDIIHLIEAGDTYAAVQRVQREGEPRDIAKRFHESARDLYWKSKHVPALVAIARGGIHYCLIKMGEATDANDKDFFGSHAKMTAYNLGSFTWPGWDEPGISLSACDVAAGHEAAKLNLRLAKELNKPADRVQDAHWLLGAHLLSANQPALALDQFERSSPQTRPLHEGYVLLAHILLHQDGAQQEFDALLAKMRARNDEDSKFIESQLATACRVFVKAIRSPDQ